MDYEYKILQKRIQAVITADSQQKAKDKHLMVVRQAMSIMAKSSPEEWKVMFSLEGIPSVYIEVVKQQLETLVF